jgi:allantoinase
VSGAATLIRGGRLASGENADVAVLDGRIAAVGPALSPPPGAAEIDADGLLVLPGAIDPHVHFNEPGRTDWEGWATGSAAAAAGGITAVVEMPLNASPPTVDVPSFEAKVAAAERSSLVDFGLWGGVIPGNRAELAPLAAAGVIGFKAFMSRTGTNDFPPSDDLTLYEAMATIAELGLPFALHAESDRITADLAARALGAGRRAVQDYLDSRPPVAESEAIARALELAAVTGCRLHIVHVSTLRGVRLVADARARGQDVTCEITAHHLVLTDADAVSLGAVAKCAPPLRPAAEPAALWEQLRTDPTLFVVSDHSPAPPELKQGDDAFAIWGGIAAAQSTVELILTEGVGGGRLPLADAPRALAGAAAARLGLPGKSGLGGLGGLEVGMDADLALIDLGPPRVLAREELLDRNRFSPYVGRELRARVRTTLLRGETIYRDGRAVGPPRGRLLRPQSVQS